jgi:putative ABC transport system ATP-binding protein
VTPDPLVRVTGVRKDYNALRPLRVARLELQGADSVALLGFDRAAAEVLVNLITAATLPDEGEVTIFGSSTRAITNAEAWYTTLDRFGILSERLILIDELTVAQNLALPLSLDLDPLPGNIRERVFELAAEVGISDADAATAMGAAAPMTKLRTRLGKALALNPAILLAEHPNASVPPGEAAAVARDLAAIAARRQITLLVLTADSSFAHTACRRVMTLRPATGELVPVPFWRRWFSR